jgi:hypothetical protein
MHVVKPAQDTPNDISSPDAKDTAIVYTNDTHYFIGFISNENRSPQYTNGHWYYDIWALGLGTVMMKCSDKYITLYEDTLTQQKDKLKTTITTNTNHIDNLKKSQQPITD